MSRSVSLWLAVVAFSLGALLTPGRSVAEDESPPAPPPSQSPAELEKEGFRPLFDGKDLSAWKADDAAKKHWLVADGVIRYDGKNRDLWTKESFGDFVLSADWRITKLGDDSGIYLRGAAKSQVNIWSNPLGSGEVWGYRTDNSLPEEIRKACTPKKKADKPIGQWNHFVITMKGDRLSVVLNGEEVISDAQLPGVGKTGPIALQHHGTRVDYCNIYIKELK
jgi:hypothetical protein